MTDEVGRRTQDTLTCRRMVWSCVLAAYGDGRREVDVREGVRPLCRGKASCGQVDEGVLLTCDRCNIPGDRSPYGSRDDLKGAVAEMMLGSVA